MRYLDKVNCPQDLKKLELGQLHALTAEMRDFLVRSVAETGGHLASNLGVVELAVALHYCLNSPTDKIVWDVGHQCYPHKILTGRREQFATLRQFGGLSGFIKCTESPHDAFDVGHSSTSLSVAHGMAASRDLLKQKHQVAAIIGDGSLGNGLALEALNNIGRSPSNLLVILNDNQMSISENVGALAKYLGEVRVTPSYISAKMGIREILKNVPYIGNYAGSLIGKTKTRLKYLVLPGVLFEEFGFKYYGPIDGHNLRQVIDALNTLKNVKGPVLLHVITQKGKGYAPAERASDQFHGVGPFDVKTGKSTQNVTKKTYTNVFSEKMLSLGQENEDVVAITAAMPAGTGLTAFAKRFPKRFFDVSIAESHAVTFAAGLAKSGLRPVVAIYSTFLQRAYDQILHDVCIQNLPIIFALDRAGVVPGDGETHQGVFDISYLAHMPNMTILAPTNGEELALMLDFAVKHDGPVAIRYPKDEIPENYHQNTPVKLGKCQILEQSEGKDLSIAILAAGSMMRQGRQLFEDLKFKGFSPTLINPRFLKPVDGLMIEKLKNYKHIFTLEENTLIGGFGQNLAAAGGLKVHTFGVSDFFLPTGGREDILKLLKLDSENILQEVLKILC